MSAPYSDADAAHDDEALRGPRCPTHGRQACRCCAECGAPEQRRCRSGCRDAAERVPTNRVERLRFVERDALDLELGCLLVEVVLTGEHSDGTSYVVHDLVEVCGATDGQLSAAVDWQYFEGATTGCRECFDRWAHHVDPLQVKPPVPAPSPFARWVEVRHGESVVGVEQIADVLVDNADDDEVVEALGELLVGTTLGFGGGAAPLVQFTGVRGPEPRGRNAWSLSAPVDVLCTRREVVLR